MFVAYQITRYSYYANQKPSLFACKISLNEDDSFVFFFDGRGGARRTRKRQMKMIRRFTRSYYLLLSSNRIISSLREATDRYDIRYPAIKKESY